jgi:DNA-directed RNA polymerase subunit RPC12/RpoP
MKKRFTFKCWNCPKEYTLFREITNEQVITVACPYCNADAVVDLQPFRKPTKTVLRGDANNEKSPGFELQLPDVLPTQKPD